MIAMDHNVNECIYSCEGEKAGPHKLLEECWFFGSKISMSTTSSHPSSNLDPAKSFEETYQSIKKSAHDESNPMRPEPSRGRRKLLQPTSLVEEDEEDEEEMEFSMGKLIRQASLNANSETLRPRKHAPKGVAGSCSILTQLETQKSLSSMEYQEKPKAEVISTIPVPREEKRRGGEGEGINRLRRTQSWAPPVPGKLGGGKRSSEEDIKAQIKFWARAVASNVRPD